MPAFANRTPILADRVAQTIGAPQFLIADVGCSGGVSPEWAGHAFVDAVGFDPLVAEIDRLRAAAPARHVYEAAYVVGPEGPENRVDTWFGRASFWKAHAALQKNYAQESHNAGAAIVYAERRVTLDAYFEGRRVHFVKTDTDGFDLQALRGGERMLGGAIGVVCEANFHAFQPNSTVWRDIDAYLSRLGFYLADLDLHRYTRAALPGRFRGQDLSDTETGCVAWANCLYLRDAGALEGDDLLRLAVIAETYGLPDVAAEALLRLAESRGGAMIAPLLDALAAYAPVDGASGYEATLNAFEEDPRRFAHPLTPPRAGWRERIAARILKR